MYSHYESTKTNQHVRTGICTEFRDLVEARMGSDKTLDDDTSRPSSMIVLDARLEGQIIF